MSIFDGVENAKVQRDSEFIRPGRYLCQVAAIKAGKTRKGIEFVAFNFSVLHVVDDTASADDPQGPHHPGDLISQLIMANWDSFLPTVKTSIKNLTQCNESEIDKEMMNSIVSDAQPLAGMFCEIDARLVPTKSGGKFTRVSIKRPVDEKEILSMVPAEMQESLGLKAKK